MRTFSRQELVVLGIARNRVKRFPMTDRLAEYTKNTYPCPEWVNQRYIEANQMFSITMIRGSMK